MGREAEGCTCVVALGQTIDTRLPVDVVIVLSVDDVEGSVEATLSQRNGSDSTCLKIKKHIISLKKMIEYDKC